MDIFSPIRNVRISDGIEDQIRCAILSGKMKPGTRLPPESGLSSLFNTSRATIREALRTLERDGLVQVKMGVKGGAYIRELNNSPALRFISQMLEFKKISLADLTEARLVIEPEIGKMAALRATKREIKLIEEALKEHRAVLDEKKRSTHINIKFHRIISASCKNTVLYFLDDSFLTLLEEKASKLTIGLDESQYVFEQHFRIYEAIKAKDPDKTYSLLKDHIVTINRVMK